MKQIYTQNDIVQFLYKDMEALDYLELLFAIDNNPELKDSYEKMLMQKKELPNVVYSPSQSSLNIILGYNALCE